MRWPQPGIPRNFDSYKSLWYILGDVVKQHDHEHRFGGAISWVKYLRIVSFSVEKAKRGNIWEKIMRGSKRETTIFSLSVQSPFTPVNDGHIHNCDYWFVLWAKKDEALKGSVRRQYLEDRVGATPLKHPMIYLPNQLVRWRAVIWKHGGSVSGSFRPQSSGHIVLLLLFVWPINKEWFLHLYMPKIIIIITIWNAILSVHKWNLLKAQLYWFIYVSVYFYNIVLWLTSCNRNCMAYNA